MPRLPRLCPAGVPVHIIQRGNNRQDCFVCDNDREAYLRFLREGIDGYGVKVHAWVLMTNHVHLLATPIHENSVSRMMQFLGKCYVSYFNQLYRRTGTLWEGRFKSCVIDTDFYFFACQRYIELNPVRAGMVTHPLGYRWSSYHANACGENCSITTPSNAYQSLGGDKASRLAAYKNIFDLELDPSMICELRAATHKGLAFGGDKFKENIEQQYKRRVRPGRSGPKGNN